MESSKDLSMDQSFLQSLKEIVLANLENEQFGAEDLSKEIGLSRSQVHRKLQKINGKSITQFIRETRLDVAFELLKKGVGTAAEISYRVGFSSPAYFTKCFHDYFGYPPGEILYRSKVSESIKDGVIPSDASTIIPIYRGQNEGSENDYRKLTTIMFSDICGYTAIMENSEKKAINLLKRNRRLHQSIIDLYNGTLIKEIGDAILASFDSPSDAVHCAQQINSASKDEENLNLHIGIHLGEVHFIDGDIYGDGVNIASRINSIAREGEVLISEEVCKNVRNKENIYLEEIGENKLKNVKDLVKIFKVTTPGLDAHIKSSNKHFFKRQIQLPWKWIALLLILTILTIGLFNYYNILKVKVPVIAIMPLVNRSQIEGYENMKFGLAETVRSFLIRTDKLRVISENASFKFDEKNRDYQEIAKKLNVDLIVEGSFVIMNNIVQINIRIVEASSGQILNTEQFNSDLPEINSMMGKVALSIMELLDISTTGIEKEIFSPNSEIKFTAYEHYVNGRQILRGYIPGNIKKIGTIELAKHSFLAALQIEPDYVEAYIGLAEATWFELLDFQDKPSNKLITMRKFVSKGLQIDPKRGELHTLSGLISMYENDWKKGNELIATGLDLNPNYPFGHLCQAWIYSAMKEHKSALEAIENAIELDPTNIFYTFWKAIFLTFAGHYERSLAILDIYKSDTTIGNWVLFIQGAVFVQQNKLDSAHSLYSNRYPQSTCSWKHYTYGATGEVDLARQILYELKWKEQQKESYQNPYDIAITYLGLKEYDSVFLYLEKAYTYKENVGVWYVNSHVFDPIRNDPRFEELMRKMDLSGS
jgi:adenylate cyclase